MSARGSTLVPAVEDASFNDPLPAEVREDRPEPHHPDFVWVLFSAEEAPSDGRMYIAADGIGNRPPIARTKPQAIFDRPPSPTAWMSVEQAAHHLGESADALRKKLDRNSRRARDGVVEAHVHGVVGRKLGRRWKVRFSEAWCGTDSAGGRR
jgi:hypothetical protein